VQRLNGNPRRGDIVVFRAPPRARVRCGPGDTSVKRVIGFPGETMRERKGVISINGKKLTEPYLTRPQNDGISGTWHVPSASYFVLGDNRALSCDSRIWGALPRADVVGKVVLIYRLR